MHTTKEKVNNAASSGKAHVDIYKPEVEEKATARTEEEKKITHQLRRKAKEAKAKMELHQAKAGLEAEKLRVKQCHLYGHHHPHDPTKLTETQYVENEAVVGSQGLVPSVGQEAAIARTILPAYPLGRTALWIQHQNHI